MKPFFKLFTNKAAMLGFYTFNTTPSYSLRPILANSKILVFQPLSAKLTPHSQKCAPEGLDKTRAAGFF